MILLPHDLRVQLRANAEAAKRSLTDAVPLLKLHDPEATGAWLLTELEEDGDTVYGVGDIGFGCPVTGHFSLTRIAAIHLPGGRSFKRDLCFKGRFPLSIYAEAAEIMGRITEDHDLLMTCARARDLLAGPPIPPPSDG